MTRALERSELETELAALTGMLSELPESFVLERLGFEDRLAEVREQLARLTNPAARNAQVAVYFGGGPVVGTIGIEAEFGGRAVANFQALVSSVGAAGRSGSAQADAGPLLVTGVLHGSFGFQLEELERPLLGETGLAHAVDETIMLLKATKSHDDDRFGALLEHKGQKVHRSLRGFFSYLAERGAGLRVVGELHHVDFDPADAFAAAQRVSETEVLEEIVTVDCIFGGELSFSGKFELRTVPDNRLIAGLVADQVPAEALDVWQRRRCRAVLRAVASVRGEKRSVRYSLLRLEPATSGPSEHGPE